MSGHTRGDDPSEPTTPGFGPWHPLLEAAASAPAGPGVVQVKADGALVRYAGGRSAMLLYVGVPSVSAWIAERAPTLEALAEDRAVVVPLAVRWQAADHPGELAAEHLGRFVSRFGELPLLQRRPPGAEE